MHSTLSVFKNNPLVLSQEDKTVLNHFSYRLVTTARNDCPTLLSIVSSKISQASADGLSFIIYDFFRDKSQKFMSFNDSIQYIHPYNAAKMDHCTYLIKSEQIQERKNKKQESLDAYISSLNLKKVCSILIKLHDQNCFQSWADALIKVASDNKKRDVSHRNLFISEQHQFIRS